MAHVQAAQSGIFSNVQSGQMLGQRCHFVSPAKVLRGVTVAENHLFRC